MTNQELETKVLEIAAIENYFDMKMAVNAFEKEYKTSEFYKQTKMPLDSVLKEARIHYALQLRDLTRQVQNMLDNLSFENVNDVLDKMSQTFSQENSEIGDLINQLKVLR